MHPSRPTPAAASGVTEMQRQPAPAIFQRLPRHPRTKSRLPRSLREYGSETKLPPPGQVSIGTESGLPPQSRQGSGVNRPVMHTGSALVGQSRNMALAGRSGRAPVYPKPLRATAQRQPYVKAPVPGMVQLHSEARGAAMFEGGRGEASVPTPRTAQRNARRVKQLEDRVRALEAQIASDDGTPRADELPHPRAEEGSHTLLELPEDDSVATEAVPELLAPLSGVVRGAVVTANTHTLSEGVSQLLQGTQLGAGGNAVNDTVDGGSLDSRSFSELDETAEHDAPASGRSISSTGSHDALVDSLKLDGFAHNVVRAAGHGHQIPMSKSAVGLHWDTNSSKRAVDPGSGHAATTGDSSARVESAATATPNSRNIGSRGSHVMPGDRCRTIASGPARRLRSPTGHDRGASEATSATGSLEKGGSSDVRAPGSSDDEEAQSVQQAPAAWFARKLEDEASAAADVARPSTAEATLLTSDELFLRKVANNMRKLVAGRQPVVLVSTGAFNPAHLQHTRMFYLARAYLNEHTEYQVVGGLLSPAHDTEVKNLLRVFPNQAIPVRHRAAMCEIAVSGSSWLAVGRWEATRRRVMPYNSVLQHVQQLLNNAFGGSAKPLVDAVADDMLAELGGHPGLPLAGSPPMSHRSGFPPSAMMDARLGGGGGIPRVRSGNSQPPFSGSATGSVSSAASRSISLSTSPQRKTPSRLVPRVMYLCGADHLLQAGPQTLRTFGCICCARPGFTEELRSVVGRRYRRLVHVVDDDALLPTSLDSLSSTKVRRRMIAGKEVNSLVGEAVGRYIRATGIADKVAGREAWTASDKGGITYNAAVAVRAAALRDHAGALISEHKRHERVLTLRRKAANAGTCIGGAVLTRRKQRLDPTSPIASLPGASGPPAGPKVSPMLLPRPDPDSKRATRRGTDSALTRHRGQASQPATSTGSLPEFTLPASRGGPALGGGRGRRHWPGGEPRRSGAVPARALLSGAPPSSAGDALRAGGRASQAPGRNVARGQRLAQHDVRRAWSGGARVARGAVG